MKDFLFLAVSLYLLKRDLVAAAAELAGWRDRTALLGTADFGVWMVAA